MKSSLLFVTTKSGTQRRRDYMQRKRLAFAYYVYHVLTRPLNRIGPSRRLVPLSGMAFLSNCALFHMIFRARFIVSLRPSFFPPPGLKALLSSYLEGALYKFHR